MTPATATKTPTHVEVPDGAPASLATGTPEPLKGDLERLLGSDRVLTRALDIIRYASDASPYRLLPQAIVVARDGDDVAKTLAYGRANGIPVTLRSGGTSLNGQCQGNGIVVDVREHFSGIRVLDDGARVRVKPGTVLGHVNRALVKHDRRVGPDPASTDFATVGGVIANNSGGMRCGVKHDSYQTLEALTFVLPSGTVIDTAQPDAAARFAELEPELHAGLAQIRDELRADEALAERVRRKFEIKNTTGYRLCAFLDADEPVEIFRRLLVGSEGTLGFVSEATFATVPHGRHTSVGLLFFPSVDAAAVPVQSLVDAGASAVELMVNATLIAASYALPGVPEAWREVPPEGAVLLVELRTDDPAKIPALEEAALAALAAAELLQPPAFTRDHEEIELFWMVREGMQGIVGMLRPQGSALIIEDVCVPPAQIAPFTREVQALLGKHGFLTGVAGHASAGNLHFLLTPNLSVAEDRDRYEAFMTELVTLVVDGYDGSLKAEHGTGRNMAPYVTHEWGEKATELMWRIKALADPDGVLNPDVLLSRDPGVHLRDLKSAPEIEDAGNANRCIECGFCEPVCPSRHATTTPRQRIVLRREMARQPESSPLRAALAEQYEYDGIETCAADGMCEIACPVQINTGALMKDLRSSGHSPRAENTARRVADNYATVERAARLGLKAGVGTAKVVGDERLAAISDAVRERAGRDLVPGWSASLPSAAPSAMPRTIRAGAAAVYLPACINRIFGPGRDGASEKSLPQALVDVSVRAGLPLWIPEDVGGHCCGTPWSSKGFSDGHELMARKVADALWRWSDRGALPVVIDATSCTHGLVNEVPGKLADDDARARFAEVQIMDSVTWAHDHLLARLDVPAKVGSVAIHPTCSAAHLGLEAQLRSVAGALADEVVVPLGAGCCGMAGDRGLLHPELPQSALREEAESVAGETFDAHLCSNRTCEIGLSAVTGRPYESFVLLLEQLTRPA